MISFISIIENWNVPKIEEYLKLNDKVFRLICIDGSQYLLKSKENIDKVYLEEELLKFLKEKGIPVSVPLRTKDDLLYITSEGKNYCLYEYIDGEHLKYESYQDTIKAVKLYGYALGKFHKALNQYRGKSEYIKDMGLNDQVFKWAIPVITEQLNDLKTNPILENLSGELENIFNALHKQFIHRDFHGENILFKDGKWTGLIDFDLCMIGYKVFDLGYIMTSILMSDFANEEHRKNWLTLIPIIIGSYTQENCLQNKEKKAVWYIFITIQLLFVAYFIDVKNEELARMNLEGFHWLYNNKDKIIKLLEG